MEDSCDDIDGAKVSEQILFAEFRDVDRKIEQLCRPDANETASTQSLAPSETESRQSTAPLTDSVSVSTFSCFPRNRQTAHSTSEAERNLILADLRRTLDKYLESPTLLDRHIASIVERLSRAAIDALRNLPEWTFHAIESTTFPYSCSVLYALCKVRGRKRVQRFLSHQVAHLEIVLHALSTVAAAETDPSLPSSLSSLQPAEHRHNPTVDGPKTWEMTYTLWAWAGMLSLVPFDSTILLDDDTIHRLVEIGKRHLAHPGPVRDVASSAIASWLARPDLARTHLADFVSWCQSSLHAFYSHTSRRDAFLCMGVLQTVVAFMKVSKSDRHETLRVAGVFWDAVDTIDDSNTSNQILRKLLVKYWTRIGCLHMPPRIATWRYQRGRRSLRDNVRNAALVATSVQHTKNASQTSQVESEGSHGGCSRDGDGSKMSSTTPRALTATVMEDLFEIPDQVEDVMGRLIDTLQDSATPVRWSAAKGIGRLTERLPAVCADDVLDAVLELFEDAEKDHAWHGACLALAELARRGLLLPHRLADVVPKIVNAVRYDLPRRQTSVGAHVRDAACYTYWACARAYDANVLRPFIRPMSTSIVTTSLLDREVNCRRAASAAFQEMVGRQGADSFRHGLDILTLADYFALGSRQDAYTRICWKIAEFDDYRRSIVDELSRTKLQHWDKNIRRLAAESLRGLVRLDPAYFSDNVVPYLLACSVDPKSVLLRHGAVIGISEILLGYSSQAQSASLQDWLGGDTVVEIAELIPAIERKRLYRGKGGEMMRDAVCRLAECIGLAQLPLSVPQQVKILDTIDACIPHPSETIQKQACAGLGVLLSTYFPVGDKGPSDRLQKRVVDKYVKQARTSINPAVTRGFSMALGRLPEKLLGPSEKVLDTVLATLCRLSRPGSTVGTEKDAETRRNALRSLVSVCGTVGFRRDSHPTRTYPIRRLETKQARHVFNTLFAALDDYNIDRRGDVGSWCRIAAMEGVVSISAIIMTEDGADSNLLGKEMCTRIVAALFKQYAEKLSSVRAVAGSCVQRIVAMADPPFPRVPGRDILMNLFKIQDGASQRWADESIAFRIAMRAAAVDELFHPVISGIVLSIGDLTESVSRESLQALVEWIKDTKRSNQTAENDAVDVESRPSLHRLGESFLLLFEKHQGQGRVVKPLLKTMTLLMNKMCIDELISNEHFVARLLSHLETEMRCCRDIARLFAVVDVCIGLLGPLTHWEDVLRIVCCLLQHEFPRVRSYTAEQLYVRLLEVQDGLWNDGDHAAAQECLLSTQWDSPMDERQRTEAVARFQRHLRK